ncbi:hypothetical protein H0H92_005454 [Tricholoma furcatifolium]|nr:hypothetical protein H0H92_005454 [Tricholoma furcatifolium]
MSDYPDLISTLERDAVIPPNFDPSISFSIRWPNEKEANEGNFLTREDTLEEPDIFISSALSSEAAEAMYTLVMTDPDAPSGADPKYRQFRHWVITGLQIPTTGGNLRVVKSKPSTTPYRPPGPPPGSAIHRYTFLLFREPASGYTIPQGATEYGAALEERRSWKAIDFGNKYGLTLVGTNVFLVQAAEAAST